MAKQSWTLNCKRICETCHESLSFTDVFYKKHFLRTGHYFACCPYCGAEIEDLGEELPETARDVSASFGFDRGHYFPF